MATQKRSKKIKRPSQTKASDSKATVGTLVKQPIDGNAIARGCREPSSIKIGIPGLAKNVGEVIPSWVQATPKPRDHRKQPPRTAEGILTESRITSTDFPLKPWHTYYDWNFFVRVDPEYRDLLSEANIKDHDGLLECEWDTAFFPTWAWPQRGGRIWIVGRWIYDCGHPSKNGYKTEIHPPKAVATFRSEAVRLPGNRGATRANTAVVYIGRKGGYWTSPINDMNYDFSFRLPPKPFKGAVPKFKVTSKTGRLPVRPKITPSPASNPRELKVHIPLKGVRPHPAEYGVLISGGWSDPKGAEAKRIIPVRVNIEKIFMDANKDPIGRDEWYVYVGINGRWRVFESLGGSSKTLNHRVNLALHPSDRIHVTVCGFEADSIHDLMGARTGVKSKMVSERSTLSQAKEVAKVIRNKFLSLRVNENDAIGTLSKQHRASTTGTFTVKAPSKNYRLRYTISRR